MQLDGASRVSYVMGYFDTITIVAGLYGGEFRIKDSLTYVQASEIIYRELLNEPEIRAGHMPDIAAAALAPYVTLTDRAGRPYQSPTGAPK
jgi:hypothetical protein